jgi:predicted ABC-type ATPase
VQLSIRRVKERVRKGGHDVPLPDLKRRFIPSLQNFFRLYLPLADTTALYDASSLQPELVARWLGADAEILNEKAWATICARSEPV